MNGTFSAEQRALYEIVLRAERAGIAQIRPGSNAEAVHAAALSELVDGLIDVGILQGERNELIETGAYRPFYMHKTGHWLGLDVHDVGDYRVGDQWRLLEPGMVLTIEPGIYIPARTRGVHRKWWDIGIRIEDDVLVTGKGCEILTDKLPRKAAEIEALMAS